MAAVVKSVWGESDCITFAVGALSRAGDRPYPAARPEYLASAKTDAEAAALARREHGSVGAAVVAALDAEVAAGRLVRVGGGRKPDDICLLRARDMARIGVVDADYRIIVRTRGGTARWDGEPCATWRLARAG